MSDQDDLSIPSSFDAAAGIGLAVKIGLCGAVLGFLIPELLGDLTFVPGETEYSGSIWDNANKLWILIVGGLGAAIGLFIGGFGGLDED